MKNLSCPFSFFFFFFGFAMRGKKIQFDELNYVKLKTLRLNFFFVMSEKIYFKSWFNVSF